MTRPWFGPLKTNPEISAQMELCTVRMWVISKHMFDTPKDTAEYAQLELLFDVWHEQHKKAVERWLELQPRVWLLIMKAGEYAGYFFRPIVWTLKQMNLKAKALADYIRGDDDF
jgi:hypothetical protein